MPLGSPLAVAAGQLLGPSLQQQWVTAVMGLVMQAGLIAGLGLRIQHSVDCSRLQVWHVACSL